MSKIPDNVTVIFDEEGREFSDLLEQIFKIIINQTGEGEAVWKKGK
jgi:hypothetical protein